MSLDWSTKDCSEPLPQNDDEKYLRTGLIWASLGLDLGSITEDNVAEWVFRLWHQHRCKMDFMFLGEEPNPVEIEGWVRRWVGLTTNVITQPRQKWLARLQGVMVKDTEADIRRHYRNQEEAANAND